MSIEKSIQAMNEDGIVHGIATACINSLTQAAAIATPEALIQMAVRRVAAEGGEITAERVAALLHTTLRAADAVVKELEAGQ